MPINKTNIQFYANSEDITETVFNRPLNQLITEIENNYIDISGGTIIGSLIVNGDVSFSTGTITSTVNNIRGFTTTTGSGDFRFGYNPTLDTLSFGYTGVLKPVTAREDNPANNGFLVWDSDFNGARSYQGSDARDFLGLANTATVTSTSIGQQIITASNATAVRDSINLGENDNVTFNDLNVDNIYTTTSSDKNLKKDIENVRVKWHLYDEIDFVTGLYNQYAKESDRETRFYGVIAQKVVRVFPWCCGTDDRGYLYVDYPRLALAVAMAEKQYPLHRKLFVRPFNKLVKKIFG